MSGALFMVGVDHHRAPLEVREHLALAPDTAVATARALGAEDWADGVLVLSTCNRTEVYATSRDPTGADLALTALLRHVPAAPDPATGCYGMRSGDAAALHLLRVACGLESAILGETEIQGQVRAAHAGAREAGTLGPLLDRLCQTAVRAGKRARRETVISAGGISHGGAAAQVVREVFETLAGREVLVLGAGQVASQAARALAELAGGRYVVANRTSAHADALARTLPDARTIGLDDVAAALERCDVAVLATGAEPLATTDVERVLRRRREPLLIVDVGVPRCVEPSAGDLTGVFLYDLDDLEDMVQGSLAARRTAVHGVEGIIQEELDGFRSWLRGQGAAPTIRSLNRWAEAIRRAELAHLPSDLPPHVRAAVERLTERLVQRLLGRAAARVVQGAGEDDPGLPTAEHLRSVFGLDEGEPS
jgi:glutamyl-tRNA reductase